MTPPGRRKKASSGATAMRHAVAWAEAHYGVDAILKAGKRIVMTPRGPMAAGNEDLFGCGDLLCLRPGRPLLAQVTTQNQARSTVSPRRRKVQDWLLRAGPFLADAQVMAWVRGKHFRVWKWHHADERWLEADTVWSPSQTREWRERRQSEDQRQQ